ncbi:MAG TPA: nitroreductase [Oleiagrimonas sp.]|nr:nitroreductase [Oleiagrimonas sp.]
MNDPLHLLAERRSAPSRQLGEPGPDAATLERLLSEAVRVPDHGKLTPWRLLVLHGEAKLELGRQLAAMALTKHPDMPEAKQNKERHRYTHAPLVIAVISRRDPASRIPEQEQLLSAGCVAYNLLLAAQGLGFGAQWLTGWAAYDRDAADVLGLADDEHVIGFVHIGTPRVDIPERVRPALADVVSTWTP